MGTPWTVKPPCAASASGLCASAATGGVKGLGFPCGPVSVRASCESRTTVLTVPKLLSDCLRNFLSVPSQRWQYRSSCNEASQLLTQLFRISYPCPGLASTVRGSAVEGSNRTCADFVDEGDERVGRRRTTVLIHAASAPALVQRTARTRPNFVTAVACTVMPANSELSEPL